MNPEKRRARAKRKAKMSRFMRNGGAMFVHRLASGEHEITEKVMEDLKWVKSKKLEVAFFQFYTS